MDEVLEFQHVSRPLVVAQAVLRAHREAPVGEALPAREGLM